MQLPTPFNGIKEKSLQVSDPREMSCTRDFSTVATEMNVELGTYSDKQNNNKNEKG
jgi:hypothetical protein